MKKLFILLALNVFCFSAFATDYAMKKFEWGTTYDDILSFFLKNEWSMRIDKETSFVHFTPVKDDYYLNNKLLKVSEVFFSFDKNKKMISQCYQLDNQYSIAAAFMALLSASINDSSTFYDQKYESKDGIDTIYYYSHLPDCNSYSVIIGKDNYYMLFLNYDIYE